MILDKTQRVFKLLIEKPLRVRTIVCNRSNFQEALPPYDIRTYTHHRYRSVVSFKKHACTQVVQ